MAYARGTFDVQLNPLPAYNIAPGANLGRLSIDKQFHGDLEANSRGEMLTAGTHIPGSAGYVAIERVEGTLQGRRGSFALQHNGILKRGEPSLIVQVVPDSGNGELAGLAGHMTIIITADEHAYELEYVLEDS